jgi:hypothetical protein
VANFSGLMTVREHWPAFLIAVLALGALAALGRVRRRYGLPPIRGPRRLARRRDRQVRLRPGDPDERDGRR